jgi:hypothetical protein
MLLSLSYVLLLAPYYVCILSYTFALLNMSLIFGIRSKGRVCDTWV